MSAADPVARLNAALEGRYRIERQLGEGGMATVYLADDLRHERKVALKVLKPELAAVVGADRFLAEIKTTANLQHPHILPLFESGEADGFLFYAMPYVEGESLRERLDRERQLPVDEAIAIATAVAQALEHAHDRGVIHRDIKPANILMQDGQPVVADFGIALAVGAAGGRRLTETGLSLGTPHYMSPEQATGDQGAGPATDVYALGCVLYEMLVGEPPYTGSTPQAVLGKIVTRQPDPVSEYRPTVPPNVEAVIGKALEKVPADRFSSGGGVGRALTDPAFRHGGTMVATAPPGGTIAWKRLTIVFASLAVAFALVAAWSLSRPQPSVAVERFRLRLAPEDLGWPAVLPDGSGVVYVGDRLMLRRWSALDAVPIPGTEAPTTTTPAISPNAEEVAFVTTARELKVVPLTGGVVRTLAEAVACCPQWGPDGFIYYSPLGDPNIVRVPSAGGMPERVTTSDGSDGARRDFHIVPGAGVAVYARRKGTGYVIEAMDTRTDHRVELTPGVSPHMAPTGHLVFGSEDGRILAAPFDPGSMELTAPAVPLVDGVYTRPGAVADFTLSESGTLVYMEGPVESAGMRLATVDLEGNERTLPLGPLRIPGRGAGWSPDGESIVFTSDGQVYTYNVVLNSAPRQITFEGTNLGAAMSPDGNRVAFSSSREGTSGFDLFVKDLNAMTPAIPLLTLDGDQYIAQWPNDTLALFESVHDGTRDLWILNVSDRQAAEARLYLRSDAILQRFSVSPDGTLAAYVSTESGSQESQIRSFPDPGEPTVVVRSSAVLPVWSPDGTTLYNLTGPNRPLLAARLNRDPLPVVLTVDTLFRIGSLASEPFAGTMLHPDGDRFIIPVAVGTDGGDEGEAGGLVVVRNFFEELNRLVSPN